MVLTNVAAMTMMTRITIDEMKRRKRGALSEHFSHLQTHKETCEYDFSRL